MVWIVSFAVSAFILVAAFIIMQSRSGRPQGKSHILSGLNLLLCGVFISALVMFIPIYLETGAEHGGNIIEAFLLSIHTAIRLFVVDGELSFVSENIAGAPEWLLEPYFLLAAVLFILAPIMTLSVALSFFKNISSYQRLFFNRKRHIYAFTELNERSMSLARSIFEGNPEGVIVFAAVTDQDTSDLSSLNDRAKEVGAICFKDDISSINFNKHCRSCALTLFMIADDETDNIDQSLELIEKYKNRDNTGMYVFCSNPESELLFSGINDSKVRLRRIDTVRALVYYNLDHNGFTIFERARESDGKKLISAVIVGMGELGTEMARTLPWFCQMEGYRVVINAFSTDENAVGKFSLLCPELYDESHNGNIDDDGESQYLLKVYGGFDFDSKEFFDVVAKVKDATYIMVALENDDANIRMAINLRMIFERIKIHPVIQTTVSDTNKIKRLAGAKNHSGQEFDIDFFGDFGTVYSSDVILNSELENAGLQRHLKWGNEEDFWKYEYNHKSSMASALHKKMERLCKINGVDIPPDERSEEIKNVLRRQEHRRWNAYMRSEGYVYSGSNEKSSRSNLAKMHNCLVTFDQLSEDEKKKDDD